VLPAGIVSDTGAAALRRHLMDRAEVSSVTGLDNRGGIFPIHRSMRFAIITATAGAPTHAITCRFGLTHPEQLENRTSAALVLSRALLARLSGADDLGIPEFPSEMDLRICEGIAARIPRLESEEGWHVQFGRELNASDDRDKLRPATGRRNARPVVEGKQIAPFRVHLDGCRFEIRPDAHLPAHIGGRQRLAYRDVASATNRLTLIAAILPAHAVSTHTLFCLRTRLDANEQQVLCALLNSFVANYLIRLRVNTHVTTSLVARLPVPVVRPGDPRFGRLVRLAHSLARGAGDVEASAEYATLQALAATLYGVTMDELTHVLSTFPLIDREVRRRTSEAFQRDTRPD
jgi:hypothetical protein